jgi:hypothetical protein
VHGDPVSGVDPSGQFFSFVGTMMVGMIRAFGEVAWTVVMGGLMATILMTAGRVGFELREAGIALIADGEWEFGFFLYNMGTEFVVFTLEIIEGIDTAIGVGQIVGGLVWGGVALVRHAPEIADRALGIGQMMFTKFGNKPCGSIMPWRVCFTPDTPVTTKTGLRPIGEIEAGDEVLAFDFRAGEWRPKRVTQRMDSMYDGPLVTIETAPSTIQTTVYHPFWVVEGRDLEERSLPRELPPGEDEGGALPGRWVNSHELRAGDVIFTRGGRRQRITRVEQRYDGPMQVCNLTVEDDHTFAVGRDGVLVHNVSWCEYLTKNKILLDSAEFAELVAKSKALEIRIHGHHIVMKAEFLSNPDIAKAVKASKKILKDAGIEINDIDNLTYALNHDHSLGYAESVLSRLRQAEAEASTGLISLKEAVIKGLNEIKRDLNRGSKYRHTWG